MTLEHPLLPPNTISLCSPWLPKNRMQGHFSIYYRLFPLGALSNSLRNLLECSTLVALTAKLDLITRALGILSGQLPSGYPLLTNSDPLITPLQGRCHCPQTPLQA